MLADGEIEAIINTTPNDVHLATTSAAAAAAGKHVFLDKPIADSVLDGRAITEVCRKARRGAGARLLAAAREPLPLDQAADR
jgi:predicted dehydrogenase